MKVIAFNTSPRMKKSNTAVIMNPFLDGMKEAGADVELFYVHKLNIAPCLGCFNCWLRTPGKCAQQDDMDIILPKMKEADVVVYGTPIYCYTMSAQMKTLIDRMVCIADPFIEIRDGRSRHLAPEGSKESLVVLVANCGLWEIENFNALMVNMEEVNTPPTKFVGALLRPHGEALKVMLEMGEPVDDVIEAARDAGRQLINNGEISPETLNIISRELIPQDVYVDMANQQFREVKEKHEHSKG